MFVTFTTLAAILFAIATGFESRRGRGLITARPYENAHSEAAGARTLDT